MTTYQKQLNGKQAIKLAKEQFKDEHGVRPYNALITIMQGTHGRYVLICANGKSTELHF